jgi:hypothetical protein
LAHQTSKQHEGEKGAKNERLFHSSEIGSENLPMKLRKNGEVESESLDPWGKGETEGHETENSQ